MRSVLLSLSQFVNECYHGPPLKGWTTGPRVSVLPTFRSVVTIACGQRDCVATARSSRLLVHYCRYARRPRFCSRFGLLATLCSRFHVSPVVVSLLSYVLSFAIRLFCRCLRSQ